MRHFYLSPAPASPVALATAAAASMPALVSYFPMTSWVKL
jgi:hypothetical protein